MALIKVRGWQLMLIRRIAIPILKKIANTLEEKAEKTDPKWDDAVVKAFKTVLGFLEGPEAFEKT